MNSPPRLTTDSAVCRFPARLWRIVNTCNSGAISWGPSGKTVRILRKRFEVEYLHDACRRPFKTSKFSSFIRQLNHYGFKKVITPIMIGETKEEAAMLSEYHNPLFVRGHPELIGFIRRRYRAPLPAADFAGSRKRKTRTSAVTVPPETTVKPADGDKPSDDNDGAQKEKEESTSSETKGTPVNKTTARSRLRPVDIRTIYEAFPPTSSRCYPGAPYPYPYLGPPPSLRGFTSPYTSYPGSIRSPMPPANHQRSIYGGHSSTAVMQRFRNPIYSNRPYSLPHGYPNPLPPSPYAPYWQGPPYYPSGDPYRSLPFRCYEEKEGSTTQEKAGSMPCRFDEQTGSEPRLAPIGSESRYGTCLAREVTSTMPDQEIGAVRSGLYPGDDEFTRYPEPWSGPYGFGRSRISRSEQSIHASALYDAFRPVGQLIRRTFAAGRFPGGNPMEGGYPYYPKSEYLHMQPPVPPYSEEPSSSRITGQAPVGIEEAPVQFGSRRMPTATSQEGKTGVPLFTEDDVGVGKALSKKNGDQKNQDTAKRPSASKDEMYMEYDDDYKTGNDADGAAEEDACVGGSRVRTIGTGLPIKAEENGTPFAEYIRVSLLPASNQKGTGIPRQNSEDVSGNFDDDDDMPAEHNDVHEDVMYAQQTPEGLWGRTDLADMPQSSAKQTTTTNPVTVTPSASCTEQRNNGSGPTFTLEERDVIVLTSPDQQRKVIAIAPAGDYKNIVTPARQRKNILDPQTQRSSSNDRAPSSDNSSAVRLNRSNGSVPASQQSNDASLRQNSCTVIENQRGDAVPLDQNLATPNRGGIRNNIPVRAGCSSYAAAPSVYRNIDYIPSPNHHRFPPTLYFQNRVPGDMLWDTPPARPPPYSRVFMTSVSNDGDHGPIAVYPSFREEYLFDPLAKPGVEPAGDASNHLTRKTAVECEKGDMMRGAVGTAEKEAFTGQETMMPNGPDGASSSAATATSFLSRIVVADKMEDLKSDTNTINEVQKVSPGDTADEKRNKASAQSSLPGMRMTGNSLPSRFSDTSGPRHHEPTTPRLVGQMNSATVNKPLDTTIHLQKNSSSTPGQAEQAQQEGEEAISPLAALSKVASEMPVFKNDSGSQAMADAASAILHLQVSLAKTESLHSLPESKNDMSHSSNLPTPQPNRSALPKTGNSPFGPIPPSTQLRGGRQPSTQLSGERYGVSWGKEGIFDSVYQRSDDLSQTVKKLSCRVATTNNFVQASSESTSISEIENQDNDHLASVSVQTLQSEEMSGAELMNHVSCSGKVAFVLQDEASGEVTGYVMLDDEPS